jgi:hypothetical protein
MEGFGRVGYVVMGLAFVYNTSFSCMIGLHVFMPFASPQQQQSLTRTLPTFLEPALQRHRHLSPAHRHHRAEPRNATSKKSATLPRKKPRNVQIHNTPLPPGGAQSMVQSPHRLPGPRHRRAEPAHDSHAKCSKPLTTRTCARRRCTGYAPQTRAWKAVSTRSIVRATVAFFQGGGTFVAVCRGGRSHGGPQGDEDCDVAGTEQRRRRCAEFRGRRLCRRLCRRDLATSSGTGFGTSRHS